MLRKLALAVTVAAGVITAAPTAGAGTCHPYAACHPALARHPGDRVELATAREVHRDPYFAGWTCTHLRRNLYRCTLAAPRAHGTPIRYR